MNSDIVIVDVQGFKSHSNDFIVKELAISTLEYTQTFLIKPPHSFNSLSKDEKRQVKWLERNRGFFWSDGYIDYREFQRIIIPYLKEKKILIKGLEKIKWIKELCSNCKVIDVGEKGCPNLISLHTKYCNDGNKFSCPYHKKNCALKNVICIRKWFYDNNIQYFNFF